MRRARQMMAVVLWLVPVIAYAQDTTKTLFTRGDAAAAGIALVGSVVLSHFDARIARFASTPRIQGSAQRRTVVDKLTKVNETTVTAAAILGFGVGRLAHAPSMADVSLHVAESVVLTSVISQTLRGPIGRERPSVSPGNQYRFQFGNGFTDFDHRAFPSLHSATAFAAASALVAEIHERNRDASWMVAPIAYGIAMVPGLTRMYLNQHWASDVATGAFVGTLIGGRVVHYAHTHRRSKLDRVLLGASIAPGSHGGTDLAFSFVR